MGLFHAAGEMLSTVYLGRAMDTTAARYHKEPDPTYWQRARAWITMILLIGGLVVVGGVLALFGVEHIPWLLLIGGFIGMWFMAYAVADSILRVALYVEMKKETDAQAR